MAYIYIYILASKKTLHTGHGTCCMRVRAFVRACVRARIFMCTRVYYITIYNIYLYIIYCIYYYMYLYTVSLRGRHDYYYFYIYFFHKILGTNWTTYIRILAYYNIIINGIPKIVVCTYTSGNARAYNIMI